MEILEKAGGLHKFMNWDRNILTVLVGTKCTPFRLKIKDEAAHNTEHH
jgi:queuine/archaeosine tRNA-ribosyltransferase